MATARPADRAERAEADDALHLRIGFHQIQRGGVGFVDAFRHRQARGDFKHVRVFFFLVFDGGVGPGVVQRHGQRADVDRVAAFATHVFRQLIDVGLRVFLTIDGLDVPLADLLVRGFMGQYHDAFVACFFSTGSSTLASFGTTMMALTFLAIRSSITLTCAAGSGVEGPVW